MKEIAENKCGKCRNEILEASNIINDPKGSKGPKCYEFWAIKVLKVVEITIGSKLDKVTAIETCNGTSLVPSPSS